jgi:hypothetical protein
MSVSHLDLPLNHLGLCPWQVSLPQTVYVLFQSVGLYEVLLDLDPSILPVKSWLTWFPVLLDDRLGHAVAMQQITLTNFLRAELIYMFHRFEDQ